jgi:hypothetical protein
MSIDDAILGDRYMIKKEAEKIIKYKHFATEIECAENVKSNVIPVIIGAAGTIPKSFRKYPSNVPGKHEIKELQKTAILGTAHTHFGKYYCKITIDSTVEIALYAP